MCKTISKTDITRNLYREIDYYVRRDEVMLSQMIFDEKLSVRNLITEKQYSGSAIQVTREGSELVIEITE